MENIIWIIISFAIGIYAIQYLRGYDVHEAEPFSKMFIVTLWGGAWSIGITFALYELLHRVNILVNMDVASAFFYIGPIEEAGKFSGFLASYFFIRKEI